MNASSGGIYPSVHCNLMYCTLPSQNRDQGVQDLVTSADLHRLHVGTSLETHRPECSDAVIVVFGEEALCIWGVLCRQR